MTPYIVQALINTLLLLSLIFIAFAFKAWFDQKTFRANLFYTQIMQEYETNKLMAEFDAEVFDEHVNTTPGMQNFS